MYAQPLTDETADQIRLRLMEAAESPVAGAVLLILDDGNGNRFWAHRPEPCYNPTSATLSHDGHPDHFGICFFGGHKNGPYPRKHVEAYRFLSHLMNPKGPFAGVLPYLANPTAKEVWKDRGFIIKDALAIKSPGLLWTFLQAARAIWEHDMTLPVFVEARKNTKDPVVALYTALTLHLKYAGHYDVLRASHGEPLGATWANGYRLRKAFLSGTVVEAGTHSPYGSWRCFPTDEPEYTHKDAFPKTVQPMGLWVREFEEIRAAR